jgi:Mrp family chromosome partitioning ATPase
MASERFVVLGVAHVRSPWFREVARWATSAMLPVEFVKAMSLEEARVRLRSGRGYSALLVDDSLAGVDRDLVELAREGGCAVVVVDGGRATRAWSELGASAVLPPTFGRDELLQALVQVATPIARSTGASPTPAGDTAVPGFRGRLVAVTGSGGTGRSTVAAAIAQGLASDPRNLDLVCLADLALNAEQAMLHGAADVVPGLLELVESHRAGAPSIDEVRRLTWHVTDRGYHLLLGLRRHRDWTTVRPRAFAAGLDGLRRGFRVVVADVDADLEGEQATGSLDVEERNALARTTMHAADLVVVVGLPGMKGLHSLLRTTRDLLAHGVPGERILPLVNRAPKGPRARAELTAAFGELLDGRGTAHGVPSPVHLPERRRLDEVLRDGARLPDAWLTPIARTVQVLLDRAAEEPGPGPEASELLPIRPGALGSWTEDPP